MPILQSLHALQECCHVTGLRTRLAAAFTRRNPKLERNELNVRKQCLWRMFAAAHADPDPSVTPQVDPCSTDQVRTFVARQAHSITVAQLLEHLRTLAAVHHD